MSYHRCCSLPSLSRQEWKTVLALFKQRFPRGRHYLPHPQLPKRESRAVPAPPYTSWSVSFTPNCSSTLLLFILPHYIYQLIHTRATHLQTRNTMYPGRGPVSRRDESARHYVNERRLPTPVNHLNTRRPQPPGPPSSWSLPPTMFRSEISSRPVSLSTTHSHSNYSQPLVYGPSVNWALPTGVQHMQGSSESVSVSASHSSLNSTQPLVSRPLASWATGVSFAHGSAGPVPQPAQGNHSHFAQPWVVGLSPSQALPPEVSHSQGSSVPASHAAFDYHYHTFPQPSPMSQTLRAVKRRAPKLPFPATAFHFQNSFASSSATSGYASSVHDGSLDELSPSLVGRATSDSANFTASSASPEVELNIILEDPTSGQLYREKRIRSRGELDSQKEGMRVLKDNGGACLACYKSKKRCGPGEPCPPCAARNRECVRLNRYDGEIVSGGGQPVSASTQPVSTSSQSVSTSSRSSSLPTQPVSAPTRSPSPNIGSESLTPFQNSLINRPGLPESIPTEQTSNEDPPALDCDVLGDYVDPFFLDSWEAGMLCIDNTFDNTSYTWVGTDAGGHLTT